MSRQKPKPKNQEESDIVYRFPAASHRSVLFEAKGAQVKKAVLEVNGHTIATYVPKYTSDWTPETQTVLDFFGGVPFRASLASNIKPIIVLACKQDLAKPIVKKGEPEKQPTPSVPSLMIKILNDNISWDNVTPPYIDDVTVQTPSGLKKMKLAYLPNACGYLREGVDKNDKNDKDDKDNKDNKDTDSDSD